MHKVTLYTIQTQEVLAYDRVRYFKQSLTPNLVHCEDKVLECSEAIDVPVIRIREVVHITDATEYKDCYLAIQPELRSLLKIDVEADIKKQYKLHMQELNRGILEFMTKAELLQDRLEYFNKLPWYKRVFKKA